ncbi:hypothetical protein DUT91_25260, partial [Phyllobacterium salinisoli]
GRPRLLQPISVQITTGAGILAVAMIAAIFIFGEYTRRVRVSGLVIPSAGITHVFAPQSGRVVSEAVTEGASVRSGDELYSLSVGNKTGLGETEVIIKDQLLARRFELEAAIIQ